MGPEVEKLAQQEKDVVFLSVNIAVNEEATEQFYINCLPTFIFIKGRAMIDEVTGAKVEELKETINKHKYWKQGLQGLSSYERQRYNLIIEHQKFTQKEQMKFWSWSELNWTEVYSWNINSKQSFNHLNPINNNSRRISATEAPRT